MTTQTVEPWPAEEAAELRKSARRMFFEDGWHNRGGCKKEGQLGRENCGPCVLLGYEPRGGGWSDGRRVRRDGPNYAGWARWYVEAGRFVPESWRDAFERQRQRADNPGYVNALERSIATFGVSFSGDGP